MNDEAEKENLYNQWHDSLGKSQILFETLNHPWYQTVIRLLPDLNGKKVLEVGAGRGDFSIWLAKQYPHAQITGTDFSSQAVTIAKNKINAELDNLVFDVENAENLSFKDNEFDFIISCETMEHVFYPQKMANEFYRVLKPGGNFILTTENYFNGMFLAWIKTWITGKPFDSGSGVQPHENFFTFFTIKSYLRKASLKLKYTESSYFQFLLLPRVSPSKLCIKYFRYPFLKRIFKPFGRHYTYVGVK